MQNLCVKYSSILKSVWKCEERFHFGYSFDENARNAKRKRRRILTDRLPARHLWYGMVWYGMVRCIYLEVQGPPRPPLHSNNVVRDRHVSAGQYD